MYSLPYALLMWGWVHLCFDVYKPLFTSEIEWFLSLRRSRFCAFKSQTSPHVYSWARPGFQLLCSFFGAFSRLGRSGRKASLGDPCFQVLGTVSKKQSRSNRIPMPTLLKDDGDGLPSWFAEHLGARLWLLFDIHQVYSSVSSHVSIARPISYVYLDSAKDTFAKCAWDPVRERPTLPSSSCALQILMRYFLVLIQWSARDTSHPQPAGQGDIIKLRFSRALSFV